MKVRRKKEARKKAAVGESVEPEEDHLYAFTYEGVEYMTLLTKKFSKRKPYSPPDPKQLIAFIPGTIVKVFIKDKAKVKKGDVLLSLQAMKMNNDILAPFDSTIKKLHVKKGDVVARQQLLVELK